MEAVLEDLRRCCCHPYLFKEDRPGPPFEDGPHLWESSGKMLLLHRLLTKLKAEGSRAVVFARGHAGLDLLQEYVLSVGYSFCRQEDAKTDVDTLVKDFNNSDSDKFVMLMPTPESVSAGTRLPAVNVVILFDIDSNPFKDTAAISTVTQAQAQAQLKPVRVFRIIAEGTAEEKLVERADRLLFRDAAHNRGAGEDVPMSDADLAMIIKAEAVYNMGHKAGTIFDEDLDALLARSVIQSLQTERILAAEMAQRAATKSDTFLKAGNGGSDSDSVGENARSRKRMLACVDLVLPSRVSKRATYDVERYQLEVTGKPSAAAAASAAPSTAGSSAGAGTSYLGWTQGEYMLFVASLQRHGRTNAEDVMSDVAGATGKSESEVATYLNQFWERFRELPGWQQVITAVEVTEGKQKRVREIDSKIATRVGMTQDPARKLVFKYGSNQGAVYSQEEDNFLVLMMHRHGYGEWGRICEDIQQAWQFKFNFFLLSRGPSEIAKRCDILVKVIERELDDYEFMKA
jgi:SWI/SNF-related matrix-associated actin-dependent regulator of chromatin subfamily A member 5